MTYEIDERILVDLDYDITDEPETRDEPAYFEFDFSIKKVFGNRKDKWFEPSRFLKGLISKVIDEDKLIESINDYEMSMRMESVEK